SCWTTSVGSDLEERCPREHRKRWSRTGWAAWVEEWAAPPPRPRAAGWGWAWVRTSPLRPPLRPRLLRARVAPALRRRRRRRRSRQRRPLGRRRPAAVRHGALRARPDARPGAERARSGARLARACGRPGVVRARPGAPLAAGLASRVARESGAEPPP